MRRLIRALVCLGSLAALSIPVTTANAAVEAAQQERDSCRVLAPRPVVKGTSVRAQGTRSGCATKSTVRVQIRWAKSGPDRVLRQGKKVVGNGKLTTSIRCTNSPRTYYVIVRDSAGNVARSKGARLKCAPQPATPAPPPTSPGNAAEDEVVRLTNQARQGAGCGALTHDAKLRTAALGHSTDMTAKNYFAHNSPDGRNPGDRIKAAGFSPIRAWGENIALGQPTPAAVVQAWLDSPGHRANIMNCAYTHIGVGLFKGAKGPYWTQVFARH
jgi:uncharacterized protein YkwD